MPIYYEIEKSQKHVFCGAIAVNNKKMIEKNSFRFDIK
jgi:hypothetical protein